MKKMRSMPLRAMRIQKSTHVALFGNRSVKQRRGWSSKNLSSSHIPDSRGTNLDDIQITKRSMHGNPVFPIMIRKLPNSKGNTASWKEIMESGLSVKPRSLNSDAGVKKPLVQDESVAIVSRQNHLPPGLRYTITGNNGAPCISMYNPR